ncbi:MAG: hypothetical protein O3A39_06770 [Proteobacteria bacterium]|nr:hypothetical protein [Pseudomonadota bacterium]
MIEHSKIIFKNKFKNRKITLKRGLELIYHLPFAGFIRADKLWWWKHYIDWIKYEPINFPNPGMLMIARLNADSAQPNTIRVITTSALNDKRKAQVLKKIFGKESND